MSNNMQSVTRTFTRTKETMERYMADMNNKTPEDPKEIFSRLLKESIKTFKYWSIIPNEYPYDAIADVHHMLILNRHIPFDWDKITDEERIELRDIRNSYIKNNYDVIWENTPSGQSIPSIFHIHLLKLKREPI